MNKEELLKMISYIEDKDVAFDENWFYHACSFEKEIYKNILLEGIKSKFERTKRLQSSFGWNGIFYISVTRENIMEDLGKSAWNFFYPYYPMFIIDKNVKAYKCRYLDKFSEFYSKLSNTPLPYRVSGYVDEWHIYRVVKPESIIGIDYPLKKLESEVYLERLVNIIELMNEINVDKPIYDISSRREINKEKCLKLSRGL